MSIAASLRTRLECDAVVYQIIRNGDGHEEGSDANLEANVRIAGQPCKGLVLRSEQIKQKQVYGNQQATSVCEDKNIWQRKGYSV